ncbi:MAG: adenylate/guanylate cyclase domain-containing protein [Spirochaeta sp.]|jgi:adenylate cyclase|nr:adenylate/guanylate cyclase domain-containing protein [Spirochaeta sp.]
MTRIDTIERRIDGTVLSRSLTEFFGTAALFPILLTIHSVAASGLHDVITEPANYALFAAAVLQAWILGAVVRPSPVRAFVGNITGFLVYAVLDVLLEGPEFFTATYHWVFGGFSLWIAILEALSAVRPAVRETSVATSWIPDGLVLLENIGRIALFPAFYLLVDTGVVEITDWSSAVFQDFMANPGHRYLVFGAVLFGALLGVEETQRLRFRAILARTATALKEYSEWSLDPEIIRSAIDDPDRFKLRRVDRTILFMDIRGFTAWSEGVDPAEAVAVLNNYYEVAEREILASGCHKPTFTADEVMTRGDDPGLVIDVAVRLQQVLPSTLGPRGLAVGIGIHTGTVIEGLMGSAATRKYDLIGDAVNTAKRLESAALSGEIVVSRETHQRSTTLIPDGTLDSVVAKGKRDPLPVYRITAVPPSFLRAATARRPAEEP